MKKVIQYIIIIYIHQVLNPFLLNAQELAPEKLYEEVSKSVVVVLTANKNGETIAQGSGVVINSEGIIVTNYHVFSGGDKITIRQGYNFIDKCIIIGSNISKDILLIKIVGNNIFPVIKIGNSDNLKVGQRVYAIGTPLGEENSMSEGIISGIRDKGINKYIQITASISPGSSGGAVVNEFGELIGISALTDLEGQNINYAIPVNDIMKVNLIEQSELTIKANEYLNQAFAADKERKFDLAIYNYSKYLEIMPDSAEVYWKRAADYSYLANINPNLSTGYLQKCLNDYTSYIRLKPNDCAGYLMRGTRYHEIGNNDFAYADLNLAISLDYETSSGFTACGYAYEGRGDIYYEMGRYDKALEDYETASKKSINYIAFPYLKEKIAKCKRMLGK